MTNKDSYLKDINSQLTKLNFRIKIVLWIGIPVVLVLPYVFTQYSILDFTQSGQIGDTIGGITAPFVGLISALIVYFSFLAQIKANQIQINAIQDTREQYEIQEQNNIKEKRLQQIENQFNEINDTWLNIIKGIEYRNVHHPYKDYRFVEILLEKGTVYIVNTFLFKINVFMEDLKKYKSVHDELIKRKVISQFSFLIAMSCQDFFHRIKKEINDKKRGDLEYTKGILSTIVEIANNIRKDEYYYRDQKKIISIIEKSVMIDK